MHLVQRHQIEEKWIEEKRHSRRLEVKEGNVI
jgi:hypothetical protein